MCTYTSDSKGEELVTDVDYDTLSHEDEDKNNNRDNKANDGCLFQELVSSGKKLKIECNCEPPKVTATSALTSSLP